MQKVLIIEDHADMRELLIWQVELMGYMPIAAKRGRDGVEKALSEKPKLIIMDIMMPGMDGYQTIAEIRSNPRFANLPIIAVTAKAMKGDRQKCIEAGASDYVAKPVDIEQLVSVLRVWMHRTERPKYARRTGTDNVVSLPLLG